MHLLLLLAACHSASGEFYDTCVALYETECRCGADPTADCAISENPARLQDACGHVDLRTCDPESDYWDSKGCDSVHEQLDLWEEMGFAEQMECRTRILKQECPGPAADDETWHEVNGEINDTCYDYPDSGD